MVETDNNERLQEIKKQIAIERLRQSPKNIRISFGNVKGEFFDKERLIKEVNDGTNLGEKITNIYLEYLKSFKDGTIPQL